MKRFIEGNHNYILFGSLLALGACGGDRYLDAAAATITVDDLTSDIQVLASDEFEGRGPSSPGEEKTINYLQTEFEKLGLEPGNGDSYFQEVPLVSITADPNTSLLVQGGSGAHRFSYGDEVMVWTKRVVGRAAIANSDVVFVGYGIVAPEYDWNDYDGLDVRGKTVVMLVNDPGYATQDEALFNGNAMTYYGRWTYKFEEAARQGAAGALIVHETEPAAYPWGTVQGSWSGPQFGLVAEDNNMSRVAVEGWLSLETATTIFDQAGLSLDSLETLAVQRGFKAVPLGLRASLSLRNTIQQSTSHNVVAVLPGSERPDEYFVYMAHWDHFGTDSSLEGDQIYNGALDNATGTAALIELAEAFTSLEPEPARSIVFLAVTAEEQGLLGSAYYGANPIFPPEKTVAALNIDGLNILGPMNDVTIVGYGNSELDDYLAEAAADQHRVVIPDPEPEAGYYYRSDHFNFAKVGIPALYPNEGTDHVEHGKEWSQEKRDEYRALHYHKPSDEYRSDWDLTGAIDDLQLYFAVGYRIASESTFPNWREGTEFKALRDSMMAGT
ncbi:MAG: M28 family metallopeptidase [Gemmatimonadales bacterium]|jgi:Zn-dependent M28 family amino/carboxypeptidase